MSLEINYKKKKMLEKMQHKHMEAKNMLPNNSRQITE